MFNVESFKQGLLQVLIWHFTIFAIKCKKSLKCNLREAQSWHFYHCIQNDVLCFHFYQSIVDLYCCVSLRCTAK